MNVDCLLLLNKKYGEIAMIRKLPNEMKNMNYNQKSAGFINSCQGCKKRSILVNAILLFLTAFSLTSNAKTKNKPIIIQEQGSFAVGGTVVVNPGNFNPFKPTPEGQTLHGDQAYVFYQVRVVHLKWLLSPWPGFNS